MVNQTVANYSLELYILDISKYIPHIVLVWSLQNKQMPYMHSTDYYSPLRPIVSIIVKSKQLHKV